MCSLYFVNIHICYLRSLLTVSQVMKYIYMNEYFCVCVFIGGGGGGGGGGGLIPRLHYQYPNRYHQHLYTFSNHRMCYDDVLTWKHFLHYWPVVREIHWSLMDFLTKGQQCGALMFSLVSILNSCRTNSLAAGGLRHHGACDKSAQTWSTLVQEMNSLLPDGNMPLFNS